MTDGVRLTNLRPPEWSRLSGDDDHPMPYAQRPLQPLKPWEVEEAAKAGMSREPYDAVKHARNLPEFEAAQAAEAERQKPKP